MTTVVLTSTMSSRTERLDVDLHYSAVKVPFESLSQTFRKNQKMSTRALSSMKELVQAINPDDNPEEVLARLDEMESQIKALEAQVRKGDDEECRLLDILEKRVSFLEDPRNPPSNSRESKQQTIGKKRSAEDFAKTHCVSMMSPQAVHLHRAVAEALLCNGYFETVDSLCLESGLSTDLIDTVVHRRAAAVKQSILAFRLDEALAWCRDHGSRLRRIDSSLEFQLRLRQFLELVRSGKKHEAVSHACEFLNGNTADLSVQAAMATLAISETIPPMQVLRADYPASLQHCSHLFSAESWSELAEEFAREARRVYGMAKFTTLDVILQSGLCMLKTPHCSDDPLSTTTTSHCPVCSEEGLRMSQSLPYSHQSQSQLICAISGKIMDDHNPPLAFPNGYVFSREALLAQIQEDGTVCCPLSGLRVAFDELREVFII